MKPRILYCLRAFTLVEMVAVMSIIVISTAIVIPAMQGLNRSQGRKAAVGAVMSALDRARMMAISDGLNTYVVFGCKETQPAGDTAVPTTMWGHAYAIFEDSDNVNFTPVQRTAWVNLPGSMAFKVTDGGGTNASILTRPLTSTDPSFPLSGAASGTGTAKAQLPYWKFDPTGAPDEQTAAMLRVLIFPGYIDANGNEVPTQVAPGGASAQTVLWEEIDVNAATGRAKYIVNPLDNLGTTQAPTS